MAVRLYVCGTRGSFPTFGKDYEGYGQATTCYVIRDDDYAVLLDCGTGLVNALPVLAGCRRVDVVLSHVHYDHIMGLFVIPDLCPGALVTFYGNFDAWTAVSQKGKGGSHTFWPDTIKESPQVPVHPGTVYELAHGFSAEFTPSTHGDGAFMTRIRIGEKTLVFTGDYEDFPDSGIEDWVRGCDWLIYDGSYSPEEYPGHEGWGHSTWKNACDLALKCSVGNVLITHYANTHDDQSLKEEEARARNYTGSVIFAREGMCYPLIGDPGEEISTFLYVESEAGREKNPVPEPVRVDARVREEELKKIAQVGRLRRKSYMAAAVNWLIFTFGAISAFTISRSGVPGVCTSVPFLFTCLITGISVLLSIFDLNSVDPVEGSFQRRPHWASVALLLETASALALFVSFCVFWLPAEGLSALKTGSSWPGASMTALILPALVLSEFLFLEARSRIQIGDLAAVLLILLVIHLISVTMSGKTGLGGLLYESFCANPGAVIAAVIYELSAAAMYSVNRLFIKTGIFEKAVQYQRKEKGDRRKEFFYSEKNRQIVYIVCHLLIAVISLNHLITSILTTELWFSHPALVSAFLTIVCLIALVFNVKAFVNNSAGVYPVWYKVLSYSMLVGTTLNFLTAVMTVVVSGGTVADLFGTFWSGSGLAYLVCLILAVIAFFMESREYDLNSIIYTGVFYLAILVTTRIAILSGGYEEVLAFEMKTFYGGAAFVTTILGEILAIAGIYLLDRIYIDNARFEAGEVHVERDPDGVSRLLVAGAREGVAPTRSEYYEFGQASNCFVLRDGSYGMILDCGSGLVYAPAFLKGCTHVDVFLSDTRFSTVLGLLAAPNPCPGARIRFFGPFGRGQNFENMNGFATPPLWPVNVIVGECISATPDKDIRLNDRYSVRFQTLPGEDAHYVIRISGALGICYTGALDMPIREGDPVADDCDFLICDGRRAEEAVRLGKRSGVSHILVSNHPSFADDFELGEKERKFERMCHDLSFARQGTVYTIS